ncbi:hypothetical protein HRbin16_01689 [bacterium HR16]|nr:hypothetical protein HRbin16_01689 [bacterium HR16]
MYALILGDSYHSPLVAFTDDLQPVLENAARLLGSPLQVEASLNIGTVTVATAQDITNPELRRALHYNEHGRIIHCSDDIIRQVCNPQTVQMQLKLAGMVNGKNWMALCAEHKGMVHCLELPEDLQLSVMETEPIEERTELYLMYSQKSPYTHMVYFIPLSIIRAATVLDTGQLPQLDYPGELTVKLGTGFYGNMDDLLLGELGVELKQRNENRTMLVVETSPRRALLSHSSGDVYAVFRSDERVLSDIQFGSHIRIPMDRQIMSLTGAHL